jgi:hypothetical protein
MGRSNQVRRAAKARARARQRAAPPRRTHEEPPGGPRHAAADADLVASLLFTAVRGPGAGHPVAAADAADRLAGAPVDLLAGATERLLVEVIDAVWQIGWQPAELQREVRRSGDAAQVALVRAGIAASHLRHDAAALHPRWSSQLQHLDRDAVADPGWVLRWARAMPLEPAARVHLVVGTLRLLMQLPPLEVLLPPPGSAVPEAPGPTAADPHDPVLGKVRALLAQAESTTFEAEAEAFTAKAHALMTRHAIDAARLAAATTTSGPEEERPITVRIPVDDPYVDAKARLLHEVAQASRCRAVHFSQVALVSVVGFPSDVAAVDLLFTSLLVQAQTALAAAAKAAPPGARTRSRRYRSSFLLSYAVRIGERLAEVNASVLSDAEAETGLALVPVMEERDQAVDAAFHERFPNIRRVRSNARIDALGWAGGQQAADLAKLNAAELAG